MTADAEAIVPGQFHVATICETFVRIDPSDVTTRREPDRFWLAGRTPEGPVTVELIEGPASATVRGYGPGASFACSRARTLLGADDDPSPFQPDHPLLAEILHREPELRFGRTELVVDYLIPAILGQRVTVRDAARSFRSLVRRYGDRAPGPRDDLLLPPDPERIAHEPYYALHDLGVERKRAEAIIEVCRRRNRIAALASLPPAEAAARLCALQGIGPWTTATLLVASHGDPDAVPVGDLHLPHTVAWALAGETRGDDTRMLELLAPYEGHRARALRLLRAAPGPKRLGPRLETLDIRKL